MTNGEKATAIVEHAIRMHYERMEAVLEQALADGFRGWVEFDDSPDVAGAIDRTVWRHDTNPGRSTRQRGIFFNMASLLPEARA